MTQFWLTGIASHPGARYRLSFADQHGFTANYDFEVVLTDGIGDIRRPAELELALRPAYLSNTELPQVVRAFRALEHFGVRPQSLRPLEGLTYRLTAATGDSAELAFDVTMPHRLAVPDDLRIDYGDAARLTSMPQDDARMADYVGMLKRLFCHFHWQHLTPLDLVVDQTRDAVD